MEAVEKAESGGMDGVESVERVEEVEAMEAGGVNVGHGTNRKNGSSGRTETTEGWK
jgi:hypothetical protein